MIELPDPEALAEIVTRVTETMFGMSFALTDLAAEQRVAVPSWRTVVLPIPGQRPLSVAIASDEASGQTLSSAMFECPAAEVDLSMVEDSLCELVNIVAGQVKCVMGVDDALGLPKMLDTADGAIDPLTWRGATMRGCRGEVMVWVAVSERC
jgi:hypothetical protein